MFKDGNEMAESLLEAIVVVMELSTLRRMCCKQNWLVDLSTSWLKRKTTSYCSFGTS